MGRLAGRRGRKVRNSPTSGTIWSRERRRRASRKLGGAKLKNGFQQTLTFERDMAYDLDMRRIVAFVTLGMAVYFRRQLQLGMRPDGYGWQPDVGERTKRRGGPRRGEHVGYRSGYMANHWYLGPIRGSGFSARRLLKPYGGSGGPSRPSDGGRDVVINVMLEKGIDFQSVRGAAKVEMERLFREAIEGSFGVVTLPEAFERREGLLPSFGGTP